MKTARKKKQKKNIKEPSELTDEEAKSIEQQWMIDMVGEEDAAYFEVAGIDDIGNK